MPTASPLASELEVNELTSGTKANPSIAMAADASFVVVWDSEGSAGTDSSSTSIQGHLFSPLGAPDPTFQVNQITTGAQVDPDVAMAADGDFVVVWTSSAGAHSSIQGRSFKAEGLNPGTELDITPVTSDDYIHPSVGLDADENLFVVWTAETSYEGAGRRYAANGTDLGFFSIGPGSTQLAFSASARGDQVAVLEEDRDLLIVPSDPHLLGPVISGVDLVLHAATSPTDSDFELLD